MKIAFWSNVSGKGYTTANTVAISIILCLCDWNILLFENHIGLGGLLDALVCRENDNMVRQENSDYNNLGLNMLIKKARSGMINEKGITNNIIKLIDGKLAYLPTRPNISSEVLEFELNLVVRELIGYLERCSDNVVIDTADNSLCSTRTIIDLADIVVVNLCQNRQVIDNFFLNYQSLIKRAFFVVGNYEQYSRLDVNAICRRYGINHNRIGVIPYNWMYREALSNGYAVDFIKKNINCKKRDDNFYFIRELKETMEKLSGMVAEYTMKGRIDGTEDNNG